MLNVGKNGAEKIGVKMAILAGFPRRVSLQISNIVSVGWNGEISGAPVL